MQLFKLPRLRRHANPGGAAALFTLFGFGQGTRQDTHGQQTTVLAPEQRRKRGENDPSFVDATACGSESRLASPLPGARHGCGRVVGWW